MSHAADHPAGLPPEEEEDLVAYLDGELEDEGVRRVEARLAVDAEYRRELTRLQHAWDSLDILPETTVDPSFTRSTIEMVALAAEEEIEAARSQLPKAQRSRLWRNLAIMAGALAMGFMLVTILWPNPQRQLARDLPVLENLDLYLPIDSLAYLRQLSTEVKFPAAEPASESSASAENSRKPATSVETTNARTDTRVRLAQLTDAEKEALSVSQQRFSRLEAQEQTRLRDLSVQISQSPDREKLRETLVAYHAWLAELPPGEQAELAGLAPEERIAAVKRLLQEQEQRRIRELSPEDRAVLLAFVENYLYQHREELLKELPDSGRRDLSRWIEREEPRKVGGWLLMMVWQRSRYAHSPMKVLALNEEQWRPLIEQLSPAARQQLAQMKTPEEKRRLMFSWVSTALRHRMVERTSMRDARQITQEQLEEFFVEKLSSEDRAKLLAMPADEMDRELRRRMLESQEGFRWRFSDSDKPGRGFGREGFDPPPEAQRPPHGFPPPRHPDGPSPHRTDGPPPHRGPRGEAGPRGEGRPRPDGPPGFGRPLEGRRGDDEAERKPEDLRRFRQLREKSERPLDEPAESE